MHEHTPYLITALRDAYWDAGIALSIVALIVLAIVCYSIWKR